MMGPDIERIVAFINAVKDTAETQIHALISCTIKRLEITNALNEQDEVHHKEVENPDSANTYVSPIISLANSSRPDLVKMATLNDSMFINTSSFNNSYGSPWKELSILDNSIIKLSEFASSCPNIQYIGEKVMLLNHIQIVHSNAVDAKWAMIYYHDYTQRGFDDVFNGKRPSITSTDGEGKSTTGNYDPIDGENVGIGDEPLNVF